MFTDIAVKETRVMSLLQPLEGVPPGAYAFIELFCNDKGCDCRKTMIQIVPDGSLTPVYATLQFGWEKPQYYMKWSSMPREYSRKMAKDITGVCLDPMEKPTPMKKGLLQLFRKVIADDPEYVKRIARHYEMVKEAVDGKRKPAR